MFNCIEWLREQLQQWQDQAEAQAAQLAAAVQDRLAVGSSSQEDSDEEDELDESLHALPESAGRVGFPVAADVIVTLNTPAPAGHCQFHSSP